MILVFLFLIILLAILVITSTLNIEIAKIYFYVGDKKINNKNLLIENEIYLELYIFGKIKIWKHKIKSSVNETNIIDKIKPKSNDDKILKDIFNLLKQNKLKLNINAYVGTTNVILTSYIISIISGVISILGGIIKNKKSSYKYNIKPIYDMQNILKIELNGIISLKIVHIISILKIISKGKRVNKYERTSYRRINDYGHEQYTRYG